jgi:hypothetical protein
MSDSGKRFDIGISDFEFVSDFDIRISDFTSAAAVPRWEICEICGCFL